MQSFLYKCDYDGGNLGQMFCEQKATLTIMHLVEEKKNQLFSVDKQKYANLQKKKHIILTEKI